MKRITRMFAGGLVLALVFAMTATPSAEAAAKYVVDDNGAECPGPDYSGVSGLQDAITDAISLKVHTIEVCAGSYGPVVITGANGLKITAKDPANRPVVYAPATNGGTVIDVEDSKNVTLDRLKISGDTFVDGGTSPMNGVLYHNSSGTIQDVAIYGIASLPDFSPAMARAISVIDDNGDSKTSSVKVTGNYVNTYQTFGIYGEGRVKVTLTGNTLKGQDLGTPGADVPLAAIGLFANANGTPTGSISNNYTHYNLYGIGLSTVPKVKVSGNVVDYSIVGLAMEVECFAPGTSGDKVRISGNQFLHITNAAVSLSVSTAVSSPCASHANGVVISGNMMHANTNGQPVAINGSITSAGTYAASVDKLQMTRNTAWGYLAVWDLPGATHVTDKMNKATHW